MARNDPPGGPVSYTLPPLRYRVDFDYLATLLLPSLLRKPRLRAWLVALLFPLRQLYSVFLSYAEASRIELTYTGQVLVLKGALNDQFDPELRRITIENSDTELTPFYLNFRSEGQNEKPTLFTQESPPWLHLFQYMEFNTQLDFIVRVPVVLRTAQRTDQLNARIRRFKPAMRRYSLRFVSDPSSYPNAI